MNEELTVFASIGRPQGMQTWLEAQKNLAIRGLTTATDPVTLHRHQGAVQLVDKMLALLTAAKGAC